MLVLGAALAAAGCASAPAAPLPALPPAEAAPPRPASISAADRGLYRSMDEARAAPTEEELKVVASSKKLLGQAPNAKVLVKGRQFTLDCIGTVCAIYYELDIDVAKDFDKYSGNGVNRLYRTLEERKALHRDRYPRTGDVVIWDNTWDANGDGNRTNDPRTHAGVDLAVDEDGTIHYVHENLYKGVVIETMNLLKPTVALDESGKKLNSGMAIATVSGGAKPDHWLAGDVFQAFGDLLGIKEDLKVAGGPGRAELRLAGR